MQRSVLVVAVFLFSSLLCRGEVIDNQTVIALHQAGVPEQVIVNKLNSADTIVQFDGSITGLTGLSKAGVPGSVIEAMQARATESPRTLERESTSSNSNEKKSFTGKATGAVGSAGSKIKGGFGKLGIGRKKDNSNRKLKNGETAVVATEISGDAAIAKVKEYFNDRDVDFTVNPDTGRIETDWYDEHRCGPGFYRCAYQAKIRSADGELRVQVFRRRREAGINDKPWNEDSTSRGKQTTELAAQLAAVVGGLNAQISRR